MTSIELSLGKRLTLSGSGILIGAFAAMCGIGGGLFAVPILHYGFKFPLQRSVATGLGLVAATAVAATIAEALHTDSAIDWTVVGVMLAGGLLGTQLGFRAAKRIKAHQLKLVFVFVLLVAAVRIFLGRSGSAATAAGGFEFSLAEYAGVALVGFGAGFTSPLLGIGGGLVAVPGLFLGFPGFGYLGARACSLALGSFTSLRSLWLYQREQRVDLRVASWLGGGAFVGAIIGVQLVHLNGADRLGQLLLAGLLVVVSIRFALDVRRARREEHS